LRDAGAGLCRNEENRNQVAGTQRLLEGQVQFVRSRIDTFVKVLCQQILVFLDDLVDQRTVRCCHGFEIAFAIVVAEQLDDFTALSGRQVEQHAFTTEALTDLADQCREIDVLGIDLVDHDHPANTCELRPASSSVRSRARCRFAH
jgi:hypothetical protein